MDNIMDLDRKQQTLLKKLLHFSIDHDTSKKIYVPELSNVPIEDIDTSGGRIIDEGYSNYSFEFDNPNNGPILPNNEIVYSNGFSQSELSDPATEGNQVLKNIDIDQFSNYRVLVSFLQSRGLDNRVSQVFSNLELPQDLGRNPLISDLIDYLSSNSIKGSLNNEEYFTNVNKEKKALRANLDPSIDKILKTKELNALKVLIDDQDDNFPDALKEAHVVIENFGHISAMDFKQIFFNQEISEIQDPGLLKNKLLESDEAYSEDFIDSIMPFMLSDNNDIIDYHNNLFHLRSPINTSQNNIRLYFEYDSGHDKPSISPLIDKNSLESLYASHGAYAGSTFLDPQNNSDIWSIIGNYIKEDKKIDETLKDLFVYGESGGEDTGRGLLAALESSLDYSEKYSGDSILLDFLSSHNHQDIESLYLYLSKIPKTNPNTPIEFIKSQVKNKLNSLLKTTPISFNVGSRNESEPTLIAVDPHNPEKSIIESVARFMTSNKAKSIDSIIDDLDNDDLSFVNLPNNASPSFVDSIKDNFRKALLAVSDNPYDTDSQLEAFNYRPDLKPIVNKLKPEFFVWLSFTPQNNRKTIVKKELDNFVLNGTITEAEANHILNSHLIPRGPSEANDDKYTLPDYPGGILKALNLDLPYLSDVQTSALNKIFSKPLSELSIAEIDSIDEVTIANLRETINNTDPEILKKSASDLNKALNHDSTKRQPLDWITGETKKEGRTISNISLLVNNKLDLLSGSKSRASQIMYNPHANKSFIKSQSLHLDDHLQEHDRHSDELIPKPPTPKKISPKRFKTPVEEFTDIADRSLDMTNLDDALSSCKTTSFIHNSSQSAVFGRLKILLKTPLILSNDLLGVLSNNKFGDSNAAMNLLKESLTHDKDALVSKMGSLVGNNENKSTGLRILEKISDVTDANWSKDIVNAANKKNEEISANQMEILETYIRNYKKIKYSDVRLGKAPLTSKTSISTNPDADPLTEITNLRDLSTLNNKMNSEIRDGIRHPNSKRNLNNLNEEDFQLLGRKPGVAATDFIKKETKSDKERDTNQRRNLIIAELQRERENMRNLDNSSPSELKKVLNSFRKAVDNGAFSDEEAKALLRSFSPEHTQIHSVAGNSFTEFFDSVMRPIENRRSTEDKRTFSHTDLYIEGDPYSQKIRLDSSGGLSFDVPVMENGEYIKNEDNSLQYIPYCSQLYEPLDFEKKIKRINPVVLLTQVANSGSPESFIPHIEKITDHLGKSNIEKITDHLGKSKLDIENMLDNTNKHITDTLLADIGITSDDIDDFLLHSLPYELTDLKSRKSHTNHKILEALDNFNKFLEPSLFNFTPSDNFYVNYNNRLNPLNKEIMQSFDSRESVKVDTISHNSQLSESDKFIIDVFKKREELTGHDTKITDLNSRESLEKLLTTEQKSKFNDLNSNDSGKVNDNALFVLHKSKHISNQHRNMISCLSETIFNTLFIADKKVNFESILEFYKKENKDEFPLPDNNQALLENGISMRTLHADFPELFKLFNKMMDNEESISNLYEYAKPTLINDLVERFSNIRDLVNSTSILRDKHLIDLAFRASHSGLLNITIDKDTKISTIIENLKGVKSDDDRLSDLISEIESVTELYNKDGDNISLPNPTKENDNKKPVQKIIASIKDNFL